MSKLLGKRAYKAARKQTLANLATFRKVVFAEALKNTKGINNMCNWCDKETKGRPQASGVKVPMICEYCGTHVGWISWAELIKWKTGTLVLPKCKGVCND